MADDAVINIKIDGSAAQSGAQNVQRSVEQVKTSFLDMSAKVFVAEQALDRVWKAASAGAQFEETMARLNQQTAAYHSTAQLMINDLQAISNQTLSIDKSASLASRALATGLSPDQIKVFTQAAGLLKNVLGIELPQAFDLIVDAAISGRGAILGNIGVYLDLNHATQQLAVSTGRTAEQITKQEKVMLTTNAIVAQTGASLDRLSDGMVSDADKLLQVEARWDNLWTSIELGAKTGVIATMDWIDKLGKKLDSIGLTETLAEKILKALPGFVMNPIGSTLLRSPGSGKPVQ